MRTSFLAYRYGLIILIMFLFVLNSRANGGRNVDDNISLASYYTTAGLDGTGLYFECMAGYGRQMFYLSDYVKIDSEIRIKRKLQGWAWGFNAGNKFYFGDDEDKFRYGLHLSWLSFTTLPSDAYNLSFANTGFTVLMKHGEDAGWEANLSSGPAILMAPGHRASKFGWRGGPQLKYIYGVVGLGLAYHYSKAFGEEFRYSNFSLTVGYDF